MNHQNLKVDKYSTEMILGSPPELIDLAGLYLKTSLGSTLTQIFVKNYPEKAFQILCIKEMNSKNEK